MVVVVVVVVVVGGGAVVSPPFKTLGSTIPVTMCSIVNIIYIPSAIRVTARLVVCLSGSAVTVISLFLFS